MPRRRRPPDLTGFVTVREFSVPPTPPVRLASRRRARVTAVLVAAIAIAILAAIAIPRAAAGEHPAKRCEIRYKQLAQAHYVHAVYHRPTISAAAREQMARMQRCAFSDVAAANMAKLQALAGRARARRLAITPFPGPGGPWAIPWAIVRCESNGQNLPPNSASAAGYYQFIRSTWAAMGGKGSAHEASRAEQDMRAHRLWTTEGPGQWDCTALVGWSG